MIQYECIHPLNNPFYDETSRSDISFEWKAFGLRFSSDLPKLYFLEHRVCIVPDTDNDKQVKIILSALVDKRCTTKKVINFFALRNI